MSKYTGPKRYSEGEMEALRKNPNVLEVKENRLSLTLEFRQQIYEQWVLQPERPTVRKLLEIGGFDTQKLGPSFIRSVDSVFKRGGRPRFSKASQEIQEEWDKSPYMPTKTVDELIASGKFIWDENRLVLHPDFERALYKKYPQQSVEDGLLTAGIKATDIGHHKIFWLKDKFEKSIGKDIERSAKRGRNADYDLATVKKYANHPYVEVVTRKKIVLKTTFFKDAVCLASLPMDDILKVFCVEPEILSRTERTRLKAVLSNWIEPEGADILEVTQTKEILQNRACALDRIAEKEFRNMAEFIPNLNVLERKELCLWIKNLSSDPGRKFNTRYILSLMNLSRASYYAILKNENYGNTFTQRIIQDEEDAEKIRFVMEYKGFAKGSRQIYMMLPNLTGKSMGLKKIRRIMKSYGITSSIRKSIPSSKRMGGAALKKNTKQDLLKRRFRLYRPNQVRLTDSTYLTYGNGRRAYASSLLDPVTGRLIAFLVSEHNDLEFALETLRQSDTHPCSEGAIYHSDQGTVYLSGTFQQEVINHGFVQSMSKRGNCQDNAPQESFFGHFKDECKYSECESIDELRNLVAEYADYYNHERGMWDRGRMTPIEYEKHLLSMTEEEFSDYLTKEEEKYKKMKEEATKRAIERAKSLGV